MDDARLVRRGEGVGHVGRDERALDERQGARRWRWARSSPSDHSIAMYGCRLLELPERHDPYDAGVMQAGEDATLAAKSRLFARVDPWQGDDFERDGRPLTWSCAR